MLEVVHYLCSSGGESASVLTMDLLKVLTSLPRQILPRDTVLMYKYNYTKMSMTTWCD